MPVKIKVSDNRFNELFDPNQEPELIADGLTVSEGAVWNLAENCFYFNEISAGKTWRYDEKNGLRLAFNNGTKSNGMCLSVDKKHLIACEHATSSIVMRNLDGTHRKVLADYYGDIELNSPNDIVQRSDGLIYFTDPIFGREGRESCVERPFPSDLRPVYMYNPANGSLTLVAKNFENPNGLCFSPDEKILYVNDTPRRAIAAYEVQRDGTLQNEKLFVDNLDGKPDGMKADERGNILCAIQDAGLVWIDSTGRVLGNIYMQNRALNLTWGGIDNKTLYVTFDVCVYKMRTLVAGAI